MLSVNVELVVVANVRTADFFGEPIEYFVELGGHRGGGGKRERRVDAPVPLLDLSLSLLPLSWIRSKPGRATCSSARSANGSLSSSASSSSLLTLAKAKYKTRNERIPCDDLPRQRLVGRRPSHSAHGARYDIDLYASNDTDRRLWVRAMPHICWMPLNVRRGRFARPVQQESSNACPKGRKRQQGAGIHYIQRRQAHQHRS